MGKRFMILVLITAALFWIFGILTLWSRNDISSAPYDERSASFLASSFIAYREAETEKEKNAVMEYVATIYPNLDISGVDNDTLRDFYTQCIEIIKRRQIHEKTIH